MISQHDDINCPPDPAYLKLYSHWYLFLIFTLPIPKYLTRPLRIHTQIDRPPGIVKSIQNQFRIIYPAYHYTIHSVYLIPRVQSHPVRGNVIILDLHFAS
jgi:hypothetical protein